MVPNTVRYLATPKLRARLDEVGTTSSDIAFVVIRQFIRHHQIWCVIGLPEEGGDCGIPIATETGTIPEEERLR